MFGFLKWLFGKDEEQELVGKVTPEDVAEALKQSKVRVSVDALTKRGGFFDEVCLLTRRTVVVTFSKGRGGKRMAHIQLSG